MKMSTSQLTILVPSVALVAHLLLLDFLQSALCLQAEESVYYWDSLSRRDLAASACPLDWTFSPSQYCLDGAPKSGLQSSVCCLEVITSLSQALASNCNRTGALLLTEVDATACANMASDNRWTDNKTCTISPVLTALADNSLCHFAHLQDLKTTLGNANFHNVTAYCQGVQENSCSDCQFAFNQSQTLLTKQTGGEVGSSDMDCRFALLVAIASLDIQNSQSTQALYECVKIADVVDEVHGQGAKSKSILRALLIALCTVATLVFVVFLLALLIRSSWKPGSLFIRTLTQQVREGQQNEVKQEENLRRSEPTAEEASTKAGSPSCKPLLIYGSDSHSGLYSFSAKELFRATENFSKKNFLGEGSAGIVYRGVLPSGQLVAVKRINNEKKLDTFYKEVENLSRVRHPNLATLLGLCRTADEHLLVYEYCSKGNLSQHLFGDGPPLSWEQRISISVGAAKGIWFLHMYPGGYIVHRDIKPTNILLNEHMEAKVSDFGLSRFIAMDESDVVTEVRGTTGYMDPEYINAGTLTFASDVYSLGVVMLQLISGRKPIFNFGLDGQHPYSLVKAAATVLHQGNLDDLVDPRLKGVYSVPAYEKMLEIAVACTKQYSHERPTMSEVMDELDEAWALALANSPQRRAPEEGVSLITFSNELNLDLEKDRQTRSVTNSKGPLT